VPLCQSWRVSSAPLIAIIQHQDECPPARLAQWLGDAGARLIVYRPDRGTDLPDPDAVDGLIVLGGVMGANDDDVAPWLPEVRALLRACAHARVPTLGVCLGHQLIAAALGGRVQRNPNGKQYGLTAIGYTAATATDRLFAGAAGPVRGVHSNNDVVVELPRDAVVLARAPGGEVQAARFTPSLWGVQWHPEVDADVFATWCEVEPFGTKPEARRTVAEVAAAADELQMAWQPLAVRFGQVCRLRCRSRAVAAS